MLLPENVRLHAAAFREADEAFDWYTQANPRVANRFRAELQAAAVRIADGPERYPLYCSRLRFVKLRKFPYLLLYEIVGEIIHIVAVAHGSRKPHYWQRRLD